MTSLTSIKKRDQAAMNTSILALLVSFYGKFSKISTTFILHSLDEIWIIRAGIRTILVRIANSIDPDQTWSALFVKAFLAGTCNQCSRA